MASLHGHGSTTMVDDLHGAGSVASATTMSPPEKEIESSLDSSCSPPLEDPLPTPPDWAYGGVDGKPSVSPPDPPPPVASPTDREQTVVEGATPSRSILAQVLAATSVSSETAPQISATATNQYQQEQPRPIVDGDVTLLPPCESPVLVPAAPAALLAPSVPSEHSEPPVSPVPYSSSPSPTRKSSSSRSSFRSELSIVSQGQLEQSPVRMLHRLASDIPRGSYTNSLLAWEAATATAATLAFNPPSPASFGSDSCALPRASSYRFFSSSSYQRGKEATTTPGGTDATNGADPGTTVASTGKKRYSSPFDASLETARKRSQHERLWDLFTNYALLQNSSEDPTRISVASIVRLLQDCGILEGNSDAEARLIEKEVMIICAAFVKQHPNDRDGTKKLNFAGFCNLLLHFANMSGDTDQSKAYDTLVRTCLEQHLKPRTRTAVTKDMAESAKLLSVFDEPLRKLFTFYADLSHLKLEKMDIKLASSCPNHMAYSESLTFGRKYGMIAPGVLTTTEYALMYVDSVRRVSDAYDCDRLLTYEGFREMLVRIACKISCGSEVTADKKIKALFQLMWLASSTTSPRGLKITDVLKSDKVDVAKYFLLFFEKYWKKDNYVNYVDQCRAQYVPQESRRGSKRLSLYVQPTYATSSSPLGDSLRQIQTSRSSVTGATTTAAGTPVVAQSHRRNFSLQL